MTPQTTWFADILLKKVTDAVRENPNKYLKFVTESHVINGKKETIERFKFGKHEITINRETNLDDFKNIAHTLAISFLNSVHD